MSPEFIAGGLASIFHQFLLLVKQLKTPESRNKTRLEMLMGSLLENWRSAVPLMKRVRDNDTEQQIRRYRDDYGKVQRWVEKRIELYSDARSIFGEYDPESMSMDVQFGNVKRKLVDPQCPDLYCLRKPKRAQTAADLEPWASDNDEPIPAGLMSVVRQHADYEPIIFTIEDKGVVEAPIGGNVPNTPIASTSAAVLNRPELPSNDLRRELELMDLARRVRDVSKRAAERKRQSESSKKPKVTNARKSKPKWNDRDRPRSRNSIRPRVPFWTKPKNYPLPPFADTMPYAIAANDPTIIGRPEVFVRRPFHVEECLNCGEDHKLYQCENLKQMILGDRWFTVLSLGVCLNCLFPGHSSARCSQQANCPKCGEAHDSILCPLSFGNR